MFYNCLVSVTQKLLEGNQHAFEKGIQHIRLEWRDLS